MFPYESLRDYMNDLEKMDELRTLNAEISHRYELAALHRVLAKLDGPAVLVKKVRGLNMDVPMLTWIWGSFRRASMAFGASNRDESIKKVADALRSDWIEPRIVPHGPCKEVIIKEKEIDLSKQIPWIWCVEPERQAYVTGGVTISKDPETGIRNAGTYRYGYLDFDPDGKPYDEEVRRRELSGWIMPGGNHTGIHYQKAGQKGRPLEIAIAVGVDPTIFAVGMTPIAFGQDELALCGAIRGKPVDLVKCETINLEVPATAEWVIEAEAVPGFPEVFHYDGPHGEYHGYMGPVPNKLVKVRVKCITHRKDPIWPMTVELTNPPHHETQVPMNIVQTAGLYRIRDWVPFVSKIAMPMPPASAENGLAVVQIEKKPFPYFAHQVIRALWSCREGQHLKYVIVVDKDIDPYDWNQVVYALWTRVQPGEADVTIERNRACVHWMDPSISGEVNLVGTQMGIDATVKFPERLKRIPVRVEPSKEMVEAVHNRIVGELSSLQRAGR